MLIMWLTYIYFINIYITVPYIYDFMLIYKYILSTMLSTILMLISLHFCNKIYMWIYAQGDYNIVLPLIKEKWNDILEQMKIENDISEVAFTTWVKYFKPYRVEGNMITVSIEKENLVLDPDWFSKKYRMPLIITIAEVLETEFDVQFIIPDMSTNDSDEKYTEPDASS